MNRSVVMIKIVNESTISWHRCKQMKTSMVHSKERSVITRNEVCWYIPVFSAEPGRHNYSYCVYMLWTLNGPGTASFHHRSPIFGGVPSRI